MATQVPGYHGVLLEVDLTNRRANPISLSPSDAENFIGGRGLGIKLLWDRLKKPGIDALSPENLLMIMPGPFSGYPLPYAARHDIVTKSPHTSPVESTFPSASTMSYSSGGGFFAPEIKFAGYDGLIFTGRAEDPVIVVIDDDRVEIRDGRKYWGMMTYQCEQEILEDLGDKRYEVCTIGPAAENGVTYGCVLHTMGRAAGRGGVGSVMASKNLKAVAVKGTKMAKPADHKLLLDQLSRLRERMRDSTLSRYGTAAGLVSASDRATQAVKNYREGTDLEAVTISGVFAEVGVWTRHVACYCCPTACKKIGVGRGGKWGRWVVEGPEYETGTMFGTNLLIHDMEGMMLAIGECDDWGFDQISAGNVIGFLMECYEKGFIDKKFTDGIDLTWGNVQATRDVMRNIALKKGNLGEVANRGVKHLAQVIGRGSEAFAIHVKGHELAAHNVPRNMSRAVGYACANRGADHLNRGDVSGQRSRVLMDSAVICSSGGSYYTEIGIPDVLGAITGKAWSQETCDQAADRIFNLEKCFNYREGFRREDDSLPERFFTEAFTVGPQTGAIVDRTEFRELMDAYYTDRGWDLKTTKPSQKTLASLGMDFAWDEIANL